MLDSANIRPNKHNNDGFLHAFKAAFRATALPVTVVMGVSGSGKTDTSHAVADALGLPHIEADNFHPAENVARMRAGTPLSDTDRVQWLHALIGEMQRTLDSGSGFVWPARRSSAAIVSSCAVLSRIALRPSGHRLRHRGAARRCATGALHADLLVDSQFATLESPEGEPGVLTVDASQPATWCCCKSSNGCAAPMWMS